MKIRLLLGSVLNANFRLIKLRQRQATKPLPASIKNKISKINKMNKWSKSSKKIRLTIILTSIIAILSSFSIWVTTFAYGVGDNTLLIILLFPILIISAILVIANSRFGVFMTLLTSLAYIYVLTNDVGYFLVFDFYNSVLLLVLLLPYLAFLTLIPLTSIYLTKNIKQNRIFNIAAIILAIGIFIYAIADRQSKNYVGNIFIDATISGHGEIELKCKPHFGDSRTFVITTKSKELEEQIKQYGEYYQGSYFLNTTISKQYNFANLKSITIKKIDDHKLTSELTWEKDDLKGETDFLRPY